MSVGAMKGNISWYSAINIGKSVPVHSKVAVNDADSEQRSYMMLTRNRGHGSSSSSPSKFIVAHCLHAHAPALLTHVQDHTASACTHVLVMPQLACREVRRCVAGRCTALGLLVADLLSIGVLKLEWIEDTVMLRTQCQRIRCS